MKKYFVALSLIGVPLISALLLPLYVLFISREFLYVNKIVDLQKKDKSILLGFSYNGETDVPYKIELVSINKPKIMVTGVSRTMQIRKEFFIEQNSFVNAGVPRPQLGNLINMENFINLLPHNASGTVLFLGLDAKMFNNRYTQEDNVTEKSFFRRLISLPGINIRRIYLDFFSKKFSLPELVKKSKLSNNVGFVALYRGAGYREDGSYYDFPSMNLINRSEVVSRASQDEIKRLKRVDVSFFDTSLNVKRNFLDLEKILLICKEKNIKVIGFVTSDPLVIYKEKTKLNSFSKQNESDIIKKIASEFAKSNFTFFDTSDISKFGGKDSEFMDIEHGGDLLYAKMFVYIAKKEPSLIGFINKDYLEKVIKSTKGDFLPF